MPDDSSDSFKVSQSKHADDIRTRRAMERQEVAPIVIRQKLASFEQREKQRTKPASEIEGIKPWLPSNERPPVIQQIDPRPFQPDAQSKKGGGGGDNNSLGTLKGIVVVSGVPKYYNFAADYDSDV